MKLSTLVLSESRSRFLGLVEFYGDCRVWFCPQITWIIGVVGREGVHRFLGFFGSLYSLFENKMILENFSTNSGSD